jgi:hypothetical protein
MDCAGSLLTRPHATSTGLSTDPAVLVVGSMTLALLAAQAAGCGAHFQHPPDDLLVGACAASGNSTRDIADVGAVQAQSDGLSQVLNIVFSQTCICAGGTYLSAGVTLLDAPDQGIVRVPSDIGMGRDYFLRLHGALPGVGAMIPSPSIQKLTGVTDSTRQRNNQRGDPLGTNVGVSWRFAVEPPQAPISVID